MDLVHLTLTLRHTSANVRTFLHVREMAGTAHDVDAVNVTVLGMYL